MNLKESKGREDIWECLKEWKKEGNDIIILNVSI